MNRVFCSLLITSIFAFLLFAQVSCSPLQDRRTLKEIEALMPDRPDSALSVLRSLQPQDLTGLHVRPLYNLLLSEAFDKNYIDLTNDSLALSANHYYAEHGSKIHRLKSWYYLGRIRFNSGNYAEALINYNKALSIADELENNHYKGLINREISNTYAQNRDYKRAIDHNIESSLGFDSAGESNYVEYNRLALARLYRARGMYKYAWGVIDSLLNQVTNPRIKSEAYRTAAYLSLVDSTYSPEMSLNLFQKAYDGSTLNMKAEDYSKLAYVYALNNEKETSDYYLGKAKSLTKNRSDSISVRYDEYRISDYLRDYKKANQLLEYAVFAQDSAICQTLEQSLSYYQSSYYRNELKFNELKAKNRYYLYGSIIIVLLFFATWLIYKNRKQRGQIVDEMARTAEVQQELAVMKGEKNEMNQAMAAIFENRLKILKTLSDQYEILEDNQQKKMREKGKELSRDEIIASFKSTMKDLRKDEDISLSMEGILDAWKDNIMLKFRTICETSSNNTQITAEDVELIPYFFSGMKIKTISYLTGYSEPSLRVRKTRIKHKIQVLDDSFAKEKQLFLENL